MSTHYKTKYLPQLSNPTERFILTLAEDSL